MHASVETILKGGPFVPLSSASIRERIALHESLSAPEFQR
jgi:hypothetical protein